MKARDRHVSHQIRAGFRRRAAIILPSSAIRSSHLGILGFRDPQDLREKPSMRDGLRRILKVLSVIGLVTLAAACAKGEEYFVSDSEVTYGVKPTGLVAIYPENYSCPIIASGFASMYDIDGSKRSWSHVGIDIVAQVGYPIIAPADGEIVGVFKYTGQWGADGKW